MWINKCFLSHLWWPHEHVRWCPSVRPFKFPFFWISCLTIRPTILKLHMMMLDIGPHDWSVSYFSISGHVTRKWGEVRQIFPFPVMWPRSTLKVRIFNLYSGCIVKPMDLKLHSVILDGQPHDCCNSDFSISVHVFQKWGKNATRLIRNIFL